MASTIPKADYENLNTKFIGIESALKLTEEHLRQKQEEQKAQLTKTEDLQNAVSNAKAQIASMEAVLAKEAERVFELKSQLAEQTTKQSTLQAEINSANERIADLSASKRALTEQIVTNSETQKQLNTDIEKQRSEKLLKPDHAIYRVLMDRYSINPAESVYIDDNKPTAITPSKGMTKRM